MSTIERMKWNLQNMGYTPCLSKQTRTKLTKWAEAQGIKVHTDEVHGRTFVLTDEED